MALALAARQASLAESFLDSNGAVCVLDLLLLPGADLKQGLGLHTVSETSRTTLLLRLVLIDKLADRVKVLLKFAAIFTVQACDVSFGNVLSWSCAADDSD